MMPLARQLGFTCGNVNVVLCARSEAGSAQFECPQSMQSPLLLCDRQDRRWQQVPKGMIRAARPPGEHSRPMVSGAWLLTA